MNSQDPSTQENEVQSGKTCVLVVDDEASLRNIISATLRRQNYEVLTAADGLEALSVVSKRQPDIIVADVLMPRMNGFLFLEALHKDPSTQHIPFLFLSAVSDIEPVTKALNSGADDFITKPFRLKELHARIQSVLRRSHTRQYVTDTFGANVWDKIQPGQLANLLDYFKNNKDSGRIDVRQDERRGEIIFKEGEIISAQLGELNDDDAIREILTWQSGRFMFTSKKPEKSVQDEEEITVVDAQAESLVKKQDSGQNTFGELYDALKNNIKETKQIFKKLVRKEPFDFTVMLNKEKNAAIVKCDGTRIGKKDFERIENEINKKIEQNYLKFILDLSSIEDIDVLALGVLVALQRQLQFIHGAIALVGVKPAIQRHLESMRLNYLFDLFESVDEAIKNITIEKTQNPELIDDLS